MIPVSKRFSRIGNRNPLQYTCLENFTGRTLAGYNPHSWNERLSMHTHAMYVCMYVCTYVCTLCMRVCVHVCMYVRTCVCTCVYLCTCVCMCVCACVQSLSHVRLFAIPWTAACQASLSFTVSQSLLKFMSIESVMAIATRDKKFMSTESEIQQGEIRKPFSVINEKKQRKIKNGKD